MGVVIEVFPPDCNAEEILNSNLMEYSSQWARRSRGLSVSQIKLLMEKNIPMFGICLGHQLMSLAWQKL